MIETALGLGMTATSPHRLATQVASEIIADGGTAIEGMVAAAAMIAVVYPHMNGIGGDGFWLIRRKGEEPVGIFACGQAAGLATPGWYAERGHTSAIPARGALAALTVPGTVGGWAEALSLQPGGHRPLSELLAPAVAAARDGMAVTRNQAETTQAKLDGLQDVPGFAPTFLVNGAPPTAGSAMVQPALAATLQRIGDAGAGDFYRGDIAQTHAAFLEAQGSPLRSGDFAACRAARVAPLHLRTSGARLWNMIPPTQGMSSLAILGIYDRLGIARAECFEHWHGLIEATKQAFITRNAELGDARAMRQPAQAFLTEDEIGRMAAEIDMTQALPWPHVRTAGDTIWMGTADAEGTVVSFIQSVFWEFGSGLTCPDTGVFFQNRGAGFTLTGGPNQLAPGRYPFHTLNPAMAELQDGRIIAYGTMGGEGQPQTQAAVFSRYAIHGQGLQQAVTAPRWLLGKTWGDDTTSLKIEANAEPALVDALAKAGHLIERIDAFSDLAGHAGAVVVHPDGRTEAASDPRSDGWAWAR